MHKSRFGSSPSPELPLQLSHHAIAHYCKTKLTPCINNLSSISSIIRIHAQLYQIKQSQEANSNITRSNITTNSTMSSPFRNITLTPASSPSDFHQISTLENHVFYNDSFTIVAFGPTRDSAENIEKRAKGLAKQPRNPGDREIVMMAIEGEDVVGGAAWSFVRHRDEEEKQEEEKQAEKEGASDDLWGIGANVKFCEDVFLVADVHMARSCHGQAYASPFPSLYSPSPHFPLI